MKSDPRIVVVGKAGLAPKGMRYCPWDQSFWDKLIRGEGSIRPHSMEGVHERLKVRVTSRFDEGELDPLIAELPNELASRLTPPIKHCDRVIQLAVLTAWYALANAGILFGPRYENIGVEIGTGLGGGRTNEEKILKYQRDGLAHRTRDMFTVTNVMPNGPASQVSIVFQLCGPVNGDVATCTAGKNGKASYRLQSPISVMKLAGFHSIRFLTILFPILNTL
ncbi:MAG: beta-ketoacyl synthase N-terminal-like domain-containing protein [Patescibacteria group bacterium]|jgi:3-oxoacyl-(acyl-carrier-protein) synthase